MAKVDRVRAKAEGYTDDEINNWERSMEHSPEETHPDNFVSQAGDPNDPSAGGGTLQFGPLDTGIQTPEALDRFLSGTGRGLAHTGRSAANLLGGVSDQSMADEKALDSPLLNTTAGSAGNLFGEAAATAPIGFGVGGALARFGGAAGRNALVNMGAQGATQGLLTSDPGERGLNTVLGGATGALAPLLPATVKRMIYGLKRTPSAQYLLDKGVDLTPGLMNPGGPLSLMEGMGQKFAGPLFGPAHETAEQSLHAAMIHEGALPGSPPIKPSGDLSAMLNQAYDTYAPLYDSARGYPVGPRIMKTAGKDVPLSTAFSQASRTPGTIAPVQAKENNWLQDQLQATIDKAKKDGGMTSDHLIDLRSTIRARARDAAMARGADDDVAAIHKAAANKITEVLESQLPQEPLDKLRYADSQYARYKVVEDAVAHSKDNLAGLSPQKLSDAIFRASQNPQYARGRMGNLADLREMAQHSGDIFQRVVQPNGMTATLALPVAGAVAAAPHLAIPAGAAATFMATTQAGRRLAQGATRPQRLAQALIQSATPDSEIGRGAVGALGQVAGRAGIGAFAPHLPTAAMATLPWLQALRGSSGETSAPQSTVVR